MKPGFYRPILPWLIFAAGFLAPQLFLLYIPFAAALFGKTVIDEYGEVYLYWKERFQRAVSTPGRCGSGERERTVLKTAVEMV
ncbi:hypothetical protein NNO_2056 [Hydrogenimonas sp.]|nr:hypothetical protein NNO_2056 [Hydrogenimonas sp.]